MNDCTPRLTRLTPTRWKDCGKRLIDDIWPGAHSTVISASGSNWKRPRMAASSFLQQFRSQQAGRAAAEVNRVHACAARSRPCGSAKPLAQPACLRSAGQRTARVHWPDIPPTQNCNIVHFERQKGMETYEPERVVAEKLASSRILFHAAAAGPVLHRFCCVCRPKWDRRPMQELKRSIDVGRTRLKAWPVLGIAFIDIYSAAGALAGIYSHMDRILRPTGAGSRAGAAHCVAGAGLQFCCGFAAQLLLFKPSGHRALPDCRQVWLGFLQLPFLRCRFLSWVAWLGLEASRLDADAGRHVRMAIALACLCLAGCSRGVSTG